MGLECADLTLFNCPAVVCIFAIPSECDHGQWRRWQVCDWMRSDRFIYSSPAPAQARPLVATGIAGGRQPALNKSPGFSIFHPRIWNTLSWGRFRPPPPPLHCFRNLGVETPRNFEESWRKRFVATAQEHSGEASIKVCRGLHGGSCGLTTLKSSSYCIVCETGLGSLPNFYL